jgi:drug/metabolite transporter (DMT)-like permease
VKEPEKGRFVGEVSLKWFLLLHLSLVINSLAGTASKLAGRHAFLSFGFLFWYGVMLVITMTFAVAWQQILKHMSLTFAFTNKPITIIWGLIWGVCIFRESLSWKMILGSATILIGIVIGVSDAPDGSAGRKNKGREREDAADPGYPRMEADS